MEDSEEEYRSSKPDYRGWFKDLLETEESNISVVYDGNDFISRPIRTKDCTVPIDILQFYYSYGYDCQRYFNLCVADPDTIIFASGNLLHFFNISSDTLTFRRSSTGGGIGHITKNPSTNHIAVGENGIHPPIIIYEWPSMQIVTILQLGTERSYSHLAYSPDGTLLLSQGGEPDYMITLWNWEKSKILLRCKSHGQDINNATFSPSVPGHLTTSGAGHIKFWQMARTFTGLKLKGELGKFGKTEISDIIGVYSMPDKKVVSGCEWGNILLWEENLIKLEVCRKNRKPCHNKFIAQFEYINGELVTVGTDGWIRVWYYETIDQADPPEEDRFLEIEPICEFEIKERENDENSMLMCMEKRDPDNADDHTYYAQDGNGGLWLLDLGTFDEPKEKPRKLLTCHAGPITWMDVSTWGSYVATCGRDGHLHVYNYLAKRLILVDKFRDKATGLVWFPCSVDPTGSTLACAFESGVIRVVTLDISKADQSNNIHGDYCRLLQAVKPHVSAISVMSLNPSNTLLVTGSEDCTIFVFSIKVTNPYPTLVPIGYVKLFSAVSCMSWKPRYATTILIGCSGGHCAEVQLPDDSQESPTRVTYELMNCEPKCFRFQSVKSKIRRGLAALVIEKKKEAEREKKREEMEKIKMENPGIEIDEEEFLMDTEEDPPLPEIYIPQVANRVLIANYTPIGTIWLLMGGYDAGYVYEYPVPEKTGDVSPTEPMKSTMVFEADDTEISTCLFFKERKYLFLGMEKGEIRICRVNPNDHADLSDYLLLPMHDNGNGFISRILITCDEKMLLSCGHDGNLFCFEIQDNDKPRSRISSKTPKSIPHLLPEEDAEDIEEADHPSLEQVIVKKEKDRILAVAKKKKDATLEILGNLALEYGKIVERNSNLLKSQQIPQKELELDSRITADLNEELDAEMELVHKKLAFKVEKSRLGLQKLMDHFVEPITCLPFAVCRISKPNTMVHSLRERKLGDDFFTNYSKVVERIAESKKQTKPLDVKALDDLVEDDEEDAEEVQELEGFLKDLNPNSVEYRLGVQIDQTLRKYRETKEKMLKREKEWKAVYASKPDPNSNHPDDVAAIKLAKSTIGDYKLKTSQNFSQSQNERETTLTKYKQLLDCRKKTHDMREDFNSRLRAVRDKKLSLQNEVTDLIEKLKAIHAEIPENRIKPLPAVSEINYSIEFPEKNLEMEKYTTMAERLKETKRKKMSISDQVIINPMDEEYEVLLLDQKEIGSELDASMKNLRATFGGKVAKARSSVSKELLDSLIAKDRVETSWEREMKRMRLTRKIYEQDSILESVDRNYESLDRELDELERERLEITSETIHSNLFFLTLHQELIVLKDFESMENLLTAKVNEKVKEKHEMSNKIRAMTAKIDQKNREIGKFHEKIRSIQTNFLSLTSDNKFADFLRRIFKKKFKPPKVEDDEDSSSSSSSDSSSEDDGASIASDDLGILHLDENICPVGCDREMYDLAFSTREERYECENQVKEAQKLIELWRKDLDGDANKLKSVDAELSKNEKDLDDFMREKQRRLNDIDVTVLLKFHQLQHFVDKHNVAKIRDCVVFDKSRLSQLYTRVGELQQETLEQKEKHKKNRTHLHRMKVDCKHMEGEIKRLKEGLKGEMMKKFGREVSLGSLYEAVLRRMIYDVKGNVKEMTKEFDNRIRCAKERYSERVDVLQTLIQSNTEKLTFLTVLEGEQLKLKKILRHTPKTKENIMKIEAEYREDIERLESILKNQRQQKELFRNDIRNLRLKTRILPPVRADKKANRILEIREKARDEREDTSFEAMHIKSQEDLGLNRIVVPAEGRIDNVEAKTEHESKIENETKLTEDVHRLRSRLSKDSKLEQEADGHTQEIFRRIVEDLPIGESVTEMREVIEQSVDRIVSILPREDEETMEAMREAVKDSFHEILSRLENESGNIETTDSEIGWNTKQKIQDLLESVGIKDDDATESTMTKLFKSENGVEAAMNLLSEKMQTISDPESFMAFREHAFHTLTELKEQTKNDKELSPAEDESTKD